MIDEVVTLENGGGVLSTIRELRRRRYDIAIDLQGLIKSAVLARASGARRVVGFAAPYLREKPARLFYGEGCEPAGNGHIVAKNLSILDPLGIRASAQDPSFPLRDVESPAAREVASTAAGPYVVINPGAAWPNKRWPAERFGAVAAWVRERMGFASVVTWGPGEEALAAAVVAASGGAAFVAPPTRVTDLVSLLRGARLMVSGDTGPTHIAAAVGTPVVGLYGPTRPARNGPWDPADVTVSRDEVCRCHHLRRCRQPRMCLLDIQVAEVADAVARRLAGVVRG